MPKYFALMDSGRVAEVIPSVVEIEGEAIELADRYHPDFVAQLVPYNPANPPAEPVAAAPSIGVVRAMRDSLLSACDWTQLPDVPESTRVAWASYRQALRDITAQAGFPASVQWPQPPASE